MNRSLLVVLALTVWPLCAQGQTDAQILAFNEALQAHSDTRHGTDLSHMVATASDVLDLGRKIFPEGDEQLALLISNYGTVLLKAGRREQARELLLEALDWLERIHGKDSIALVDTLKAAADTWGGHIDNSARHWIAYKRVLKITAKHYGKDSIEYADASLGAAASVSDLSYSDVGEYQARTALKIYRKQLTSPDGRIGAVLFFLGKTRVGKGRFLQAIEYLEESLEHFPDDMEQYKIQRLRIHGLLVQAYDYSNQPEKVDEHVAAAGRESQFDPSQDMVPLIQVRAEYPEQFFRRGIEGYVDVEFIVDHTGRVVNAVEINTEHRYGGENLDRQGGIPRPGDVRGMKYESLAEAAIEAVSRYRYAPRYVDGEPAVTIGVAARIIFDIDD